MGLPSYGSMGRAARAALDKYNPLSISENREYSGAIIAVESDSYGMSGYGYTEALRGGSTSTRAVNSQLKERFRQPDAIGDYHTHGGFATDSYWRRWNARFSGADILNTHLLDVKYRDRQRSRGVAEGDLKHWVSYLGTPSGYYFSYSPQTEVRLPHSAERVMERQPWRITRSQRVLHRP